MYNKNESQELIKTPGVQFPDNLNNLDFNDSLTRYREIVNNNYMQKSKEVAENNKQFSSAYFEDNKKYVDAMYEHVLVKKYAALHKKYYGDKLSVSELADAHDYAKETVKDMRLVLENTLSKPKIMMKPNEGEVPQYYVEHSHEAIITPVEWDMVQAEIALRKTLGREYSGNSVFSSKLVCGSCGGFYVQKV